MFCSFKHFQVLGMLLLGVALGYNSRSWQAHIFLGASRGPGSFCLLKKKSSQALRTLVSFAETQLGNFVSEGWLGSSASKRVGNCCNEKCSRAGDFPYFLKSEITIQKKSLKGFLWLTIVICNKKILATQVEISTSHCCNSSVGVDGSAEWLNRQDDEWCELCS